MSGCDTAPKISQDTGDDTGDTDATTNDTPVSVAPYFLNKDVEYAETAEKIPNDTIIGKYKEDIIKSYTAYIGGSGIETTTPTTTWAELDYYFNFYKSGKIKVDPYKDWDLVTLDLQCEGPCSSAQIYRFAYKSDSGDLVLLDKHTRNDIKQNPPSLITPLSVNKDSSTLLNDIELPEKIALADSGKFITRSIKDSRYLTPIEGDLTKAFDDPEFGAVYMSADPQNGWGCFYLKSPDGIASTYDYDPGFFTGNGAEVTWTDGSKTKLIENYDYLSRGCGISGNCYYTENATLENLELRGETDNGTKLYAAKNPVKVDPNAPDKYTPEQVKLDETYKNYETSYQYMDEATKGKLMSFEEFTKANALLYWQDPLNRWSTIILKQVMLPAECGKPVIYLYPEQNMDVSIEVGISTLTKTIPEYGAGWKVLAKKGGEIYNYTDRETYPYLFWEGESSMSVNADKGFVVARKDLEDFLKNSLKKLGLTTQERSDFMDFWLSRMLKNTNPYFFISFLGTQEFNKIAPLNINPKPNTLIRVFMYYMPVNENFKAAPQQLNSVKRNGFTVVEWGGTSSSPWED